MHRGYLHTFVIWGTAQCRVPYQPLPTPCMKGIRFRLPMSIRRNMTSAVPPQYKEDPTKGQTYRYQNSLPKLPVPTLKETCKLYLRTLKPLLQPEQYARSERAVTAFVEKDGVELQRRLEAHASNPNVKNWLYDFWNEAAYMGYRDPVVPYVSYFYSYKDDPRFKTPAKRAAAITSAIVNFKKQLDTKTLEPDFMRKAPIDMELFKFMFHNCRIPGAGVDTNATYSSEGNEYFIVLRRNRFFKVPIYTDGRELTTEEFENQLSKIYSHADVLGTAPNVGALTGTNRDVWLAARGKLIEAAPQNGELLRTIEASAFVLNLDFAYPDTKEERQAQYWHGNGKNRFYDKPLQFVVNDNTTAGFLGEHSMMDGTQTHRLNEYVCDQLFHDKLKLTAGINYNEPPNELVFGIDDTVAQLIASAEISIATEIAQHEIVVWRFEQYGKNTIKTFKTSPDAYVQMLLQLAYYKLNGCLRPVYESAATRKFALGRTETCRSVSIESKQFVEAFFDSDVSDKQKIELFRKAVNQQVKYISDASEGRGVDRHLFGLKKMLKPSEEVPELFRDPAYSYSGSWYISSSQLSSDNFNGYGWSQTNNEGFGTPYMINPNNIQVNICSKNMGSVKLRDALEESAVKLAELLTGELNKAKL